MDNQLVQQLSQNLGISPVQVIREEYELLLLDKIFASPFATKLVFRGGTALRLAYKSARFSDDLDFSQTGTISPDLFTQWCQKVPLVLPNLILSEALKKRFTLFALFKNNDPALSQNISIKLELSTRKEKWQKGTGYQLLALSSRVTPITALAQVASLTKIKQEKSAINPPRVRDVYDLWYINQLLNQPTAPDFTGFNPIEVKRELNRLLAVDARQLIGSWLKLKKG